MVIHLHSKEVAHLSIGWNNVLQEGNMADHVSQRTAFVKVAHYDTHATLILGHQLDTAVLNPVVIYHKSSYVD